MIAADGRDLRLPGLDIAHRADLRKFWCVPDHSRGTTVTRFGHLATTLDWAASFLGDRWGGGNRIS
jgi:hypothetical protein